MKRQLLTLALIAGGISTAFASTEVANEMSVNTVETAATAGQPKVAIVSVYCNKEIATPDFTGMAAAITRLADDEDFNLTPMVGKIHDKVFSEYTSNLEYDFVSEEEVLNNPKYEKSIFEAGSWSGNYEQRDRWYLRPDGYLPISTNPGKKVSREAFSRFDGIDGIMMVSISYELEKVGMEVMGFGNARMKAIGTIRIVDANGKKMFKVVQFASSKDKIKFSLGGMFKTEELMPLAEDATQQLFEKLDARIIQKNKKKK